MPTKCVVVGCPNYFKKDSQISFFTFPKAAAFQQRWLKACGVNKENIDCSKIRVCSQHFEPDSYKPKTLYEELVGGSKRGKRMLRDNALPTLYVFQDADAEKINTYKRKVTCEDDGNATAVKQRKILDAIQIIPTENCNNDDNKIAKEVPVIPNARKKGNKKELLGEAPVFGRSQTPLQLQQEIAELLEIIKELQAHSDVLAIRNQNLSESLKVMSEKVYGLENEIIDLNSKNAYLETRVETLDKIQKNIYANFNKQVYDILKPLFTDGQIEALITKKTRINWVAEDIAAAISLRCVSPKAYKYLRKNGMPLPSLSTLKKWARNLKFLPGVLNEAMALMKKQKSELKTIERLSVLSFDEMSLSQTMSIDRKFQNVYGPHKLCQVVMSRGLMGGWKEPIYYEYDQAMTKEILFEIIDKLNDSGYPVVAITSDMGATNRSLWKNLGIDHENCYFVYEDRKIHVFADMPHLIKLARNHLFDNGFYFNEKFIDKRILQLVVNSTLNQDIKLAHKLTQSHLDITGSARQRVRPAVQIFSNTTSKAIEFYGLKGFLKNENWLEASYLFKTLNDWFDMFNARRKYGPHPGVNAFGIDLERTTSIIEKTNEIISSLRVGKHKTLLPFQKGILLNNKSLPSLYNYLSETYGISYINTYRLNQDVLENFFSYIRGMGATNDHPTALDFRHRLRWYVLGKKSTAIFTTNTNTEASDETCLQFK